MRYYSSYGKVTFIVDAQRHIHEATTVDLGCTMLIKNELETLNDNDTLNH